MRSVPWWGVLSAIVAPVALIGGWTLAAFLQPDPFDAVSRSISSLYAYGASDRWVMMLALFAVAGCNLLSGLALRAAAPPGRLLLIAGGLFGLLVAASPEAMGGGSLQHELAAGLGCAAMTAWPFAARRTEPWAPAGLRPAAAAAATAILLGLVAWFCAEVVTGAGQEGLAERVLTGAQTVWPLLVVLTVVAAARRRQLVPQPASSCVDTRR